MFRVVASLICFGLFLSGCNSATTQVEVPDQLTIYSIDGTKDGTYWPAMITETHFFGNPILGKLEVTDHQQRREIAIALQQGINEGSAMNKCFWPRHGIRAVYQNNKTIDFVICFECLLLHRFDGQAGVDLATTKIAEQRLNDLLKSANIPIAPPSF